jgi:hypothetical protein
MERLVEQRLPTPFVRLKCHFGILVPFLLILSSAASRPKFRQSDPSGRF